MKESIMLASGCNDCLLEHDWECTDYKCLHPDTKVSSETVRKAVWEGGMPSDCPLYDSVVSLRLGSPTTIIQPWTEEDDE